MNNGKTTMRSGEQFIYLKQKYPDLKIAINDLNPELYLFWHLAQSDLSKLVAEVRHVKENYQAELASLKAELEQTKVLAIGEIGLDYYWDTTFAAEQMDAFQQQCHWALDKGLWVDIHCRKAYADLIKTFKLPEFKELRGIIHCFSGDAKEAKVLTDLGFLLGIGGVITYKNSGLTEVLNSVELKHLVVETDAPYLSPAPFRGKRNESSYLSYIIEKISGIYKLSDAIIAEVTSQNAIELFQLEKFKSN